MIVKSYKSRNDQSRIMFILSSQNFLQAYKRIQYMKQYAGFRKMQGDEIQEKQDKLGVAVVKLEKDKKNKEKVIAENEAEKKTLEEKRKEQEQLAKIIQKDKKKYAADIDKKQKESSNVDKGSKSSALGCLTLIVFCGLIYWMFFYSSYSDEQLSRACECYENSYDYTGKPGDDLSQSDLKIRVDCFDLFKPDDFKLLEDDINEIDKMMQDASIEAR